ncbi:MAG: hypothetical protein WCW93_00960 [Candidatus Paceibacterota bacterium]
MKKINTSIDPKLWVQWNAWKDSPVLKSASSFPFSFIQNMTGAKDDIDEKFKDFLGEYLRPEGVKRNYLLAVFRNSNRMTVVLSEWINQIFVDLSLYEPGMKESSFELVVIFRQGFSVGYSFMKPPTNLP